MRDSVISAARIDHQNPMRSVLLAATLEFFTFGCLIVPITVALSLKVLTIVPASQKEVALAAVAAAGAISAMLANPIFGHFSDRTRSKFGRRRPWIIGGAVAGLLSSVLMATANSIPLLALSWILASASYNACLAALYALIADQVPDNVRAKASGIFGSASFLGTIPGMAIVAIAGDALWLAILAMPTLMLIASVVICAVLRDEPVRAPRGGGGGIIGVFSAFLFNPVKHWEFSLVWAQRFVMQFGYTIVGTFGLFYLILRLRMDPAGAASLVSLSTIVGSALNFIAALGCGYLAARRGKYGVFIVAAAAIMAASLLLKGFTGSVAVFWISTTLAGFALGCYYAIDLALCMRVVPLADSGKFLGIFNLAKTLPQSAAPVVAPMVLMIGGTDPIAGGDKNYAALYVGGAILLLLSLLPMLGVKRALSRPINESPVIDSPGAESPSTDAPVGTPPDAEPELETSRA